MVLAGTLGATTITCDHVTADATGEKDKISRLLAWMDANIAKEAVDSFTAADVLRERRAECQGHEHVRPRADAAGRERPRADRSRQMTSTVKLSREECERLLLMLPNRVGRTSRSSSGKPAASIIQARA